MYFKLVFRLFCQWIVKKLPSLRVHVGGGGEWRPAPPPIKSAPSALAANYCEGVDSQGGGANVGGLKYLHFYPVRRNIFYQLPIHFSPWTNPVSAPSAVIKENNRKLFRNMRN